MTETQKARLIAEADAATERDRLRDSNADLLEAAKIAEEYIKLIVYRPTNILKIITAAIRKAEGEINAN